MTWYFVSFISLSMYIGPMSKPQCDQVSVAVPTLGMCREVTHMRVCQLNGSQGIICPDFGDIPSVTVRPQ